MGDVVLLGLARFTSAIRQNGAQSRTSHYPSSIASSTSFFLRGHSYGLPGRAWLLSKRISVLLLFKYSGLQ